MNIFALAEDKEWGTLSETATRCIIWVEVSLRALFPAAEVELLAAGLRYTLLQAMVFCVRGYFLLCATLRLVPRRVADSRRYKLSSVIFLLTTTITMMGCSVRKFAVNKLGDSLANSGTTFASDNDPEFVGQAIPFSLKLIEGLLAESPKHQGLLFAAESGFTQYSYAYVQQSPEQVEIEDVAKSRALAESARNLYLRARDYGLRGLETKRRGFTGSLRENPRAAVRMATTRDVPLLYWTAVAWGAAISLSKDRPDAASWKLLYGSARARTPGFLISIVRRIQ